jgi:hypothetical protein
VAVADFAGTMMVDGTETREQQQQQQQHSSAYSFWHAKRFYLAFSALFGFSLSIHTSSVQPPPLPHTHKKKTRALSQEERDGCDATGNDDNAANNDSQTRIFSFSCVDAKMSIFVARHK